MSLYQTAVSHVVIHTAWKGPNFNIRQLKKTNFISQNVRIRKSLQMVDIPKILVRFIPDIKLEESRTLSAVPRLTFKEFSGNVHIAINTLAVGMVEFGSARSILKGTSLYNTVPSCRSLGYNRQNLCKSKPHT